MRRLFVMAAMAMAVSGCATRGPLRVACPGFGSYLHALKLTPLERQARAAGLPGNSPLSTDGANDALTDLLLQSYDRLNGGNNYLTVKPADPDNRPILLLSGGGQWGAFGVGFLEQLIVDHKYPDFGIATGVSTGGLQSLFVGYGLDKGDALPTLRRAYTPDRENDVVKRESTKALAVLTGAMANLGPLRDRIQAALCPKLYAKKNTSSDTCMIDELRRSNRTMLIGFVEANSGEFKFVGVQDMLDRIAARYPNDPDGATRESGSCVTGAALSSAAMPVFFQQVNVDGKTYYDGGVRDSVFLGAIKRAKDDADKEIERRKLLWFQAQPKIARVEAVVPPLPPPSRPPLYVIRNGPTTLDPQALPGDSAAVDTSADALTAALRAEAIVVNQLEVGSLTALRLYDPDGDINLISAEGWKTFRMAATTMSNGRPQPYPRLGGRSCGELKKPKDAMFVPDFMKCLQQLGAERARYPWIQLCRYDGTEKRAECRAPTPLLIRVPQ